MTLIKDAVEALHTRLAELTPSATPEQLAYLGKSIQNIGGQGTVLDIVALTDEKLQELIDAATAHLADMNNAEANAITLIDTTKTDGLNELENHKVMSLSTMDTAKNTHLLQMDTEKTNHVNAISAEGAIQLASLTSLSADFQLVNDVPGGSTIMTEVGAVQSNLDSINDVPTGSTILTEISNHTATNAITIEPGELPFLFGIVSRYADNNQGVGDFTSQLGQWHNNNGDNILKLLAGSNDWTTEYIGFYKHPQLCFLQGSNGSFNFRELYSKYSQSSNQYTYPYALVGSLFIKNVTSTDITQPFYFGGSSYWSSGYEGAGLHVGEPNADNSDPSLITTINWSNLYNYTSNTTDFGSQSVNVTIPANTTIALILYTSGNYLAAPGGFYVSFMHWYVYNFRSQFLTSGLEMDIERTVKAWKSPGMSQTFEIWH